MMKKKNMAIAMAAVTVASSVAPAFAATQETTIMKSEQGKLVQEVRNLLAQKYSDKNTSGYRNGEQPEGLTNEALNSVYEIKVGDKAISTVAELKTEIAKAGEQVVTITNKGFTKDANGKIVDKAVEKYTVKELIGLEFKKVDALRAAGDVAKVAPTEEQKTAYTTAFEAAEKMAKKAEDLKIEDAKVDELKAAIAAKINPETEADGAVVVEKTTALTNATAAVKLLVDAAEAKSELEAAIVKLDAALVDANKMNERAVNANAKGDKIDDLQLAILTTKKVDRTKKDKVEEATTALTEATKAAGPVVEAAEAAKGGDALKGAEGVESATFSDTTNKLTINLEGGKTIVLSAGDAKLNFAKPKKDANKKVVGFEAADAVDIAKEVVSITKLTENNLKDVKSSQLYDGVKLTADGKAMMDAINKGVTVKVNKEDVHYDVAATTPQGVETVKVDKEYKLVIEFKLSKPDKVVAGDNTKLDHTVTLTSGNKDELTKIEKMIGKEIGTVTEVSGSNRIETAISVSNELYAKGKAKSIVLVGKDAVVDGLAASPLASAIDAPILLTDAGTLPADVKAEIKRVLDTDNKSSNDLKKVTVYVVGGETRVSAKVEAELATIGVKVERLAGETRTQTSIEIAKELKKKSAKMDSNAFVVGYDGEVDAMSVASKAGKSNAPIIVADRAGLSKNAKEFIDDEAIKANIIGGETVVSTTIEGQLAEILGTSGVDRVKGARRSETNANVIEKFHKDAKNVYVAKDGKTNKDQLIDSLVGARLADGAPMVLSTDSIANEQLDAIETVNNGTGSLVQIGGGVASSVVAKLAKLLGL